MGLRFRGGSSFLKGVFVFVRVFVFVMGFRVYGSSFSKLPTESMTVRAELMARQERERQFHLPSIQVT